jgi:hypothetical protein
VHTQHTQSPELDPYNQEKKRVGLSMVANRYNSSYSGGGDQEDRSLLKVSPGNLRLSSFWGYFHKVCQEVYANNIWKFMDLVVFCVVLENPTFKSFFGGRHLLLVKEDKTMKAFVAC